MVGAGGADGVIDEGIGIHPAAAHEFPGGEAEVLGAGFEDDVEDAAAGFAVLGIVGVLLDGEFLDGIDDGDVGDVVVPELGVVGSAVHEEFVIGLATAIDGPFGDGAVIEGALPDSGAAEGDAGHHGAKHEGVTGVEGEGLDLLLIDDADAGGGLGFEHGGFGGDGDVFGDGADFEDDFDTDDAADFEGDVFADELFESVGGDSEPVLTGAKEGDGVRTVGAGGSRRSFVVGDVDGLDASAGDGAARRVIDVTRDGGAEVLRGSERGGETERRERVKQSLVHFWVTPVTIDISRQKVRRRLTRTGMEQYHSF